MYEIKLLEWSDELFPFYWDKADEKMKGYKAKGYCHTEYMLVGDIEFYRYASINVWDQLIGITAQEHYEDAIKKHLLPKQPHRKKINE